MCFPSVLQLIDLFVFLRALLTVAKGLSAEVQVQILAATHSPLGLASMEPHFDEDGGRLFCFDVAAGSVTFAETPWANVFRTSNPQDVALAFLASHRLDGEVEKKSAKTERLRRDGITPTL